MLRWRCSRRGRTWPNPATNQMASASSSNAVFPRIIDERADGDGLQPGGIDTPMPTAHKGDPARSPTDRPGTKYCRANDPIQPTLRLVLLLDNDLIRSDRW
jgi:hypothetical protein